MTESEEDLPSEVYSLCDEAIKKIDDLEQKRRDDHRNAGTGITRYKKEIVVKLAELLDKLIPQTDTISTTILKLLKGRVSKSLIHKFLDVKYKQEYRRKNALKQNKKKIKNKRNSAPLLALNQQKYLEEKEEEKQQKVAVMIGPDGRSITQIKEDKGSTESEDNADYTRKDKNFFRSSSYQQQQEQDNNDFKEYDDRFNNEPEDPNYNDLNEQGDIHEKPRLLTDVENKSKITEEAFVEHSVENDKDVLLFEFPINRKDIQDYLNIVDGDVTWINVTINTKTKKITHAFGRLNHQNVAEKSSRYDSATIDTAEDRENGQ